MYKVIIFLWMFALGAIEPFPDLSEKKYVNDRTHSLKPEEITTLDQRLSALDKDEGVQLIVVLVPTLEGSKIEDIAQLFMTRWEIGSHGKDSGCLLLISTGEKSCYIDLGYGLEGRIDEQNATEICHDVIEPYLEKDQAGTAVQKGVEAIFSAVGVDFNGQGLYETTEWWGKASLLFCFLNVFFLFLLARFSSTRYWWLSPIFGFAIGITQSFGFAIVMSILATVMILICIILRKKFQA